MEVLLRVEGCDDAFLAVALDATVASVRSQAGNGDWDFTLDSGGSDAEVLSDDVRLCDLPAEDGIVLRARLCQRLAAQHELENRFPDALDVRLKLRSSWFISKFLNRADGSLDGEGTRLLRLVRQAHGMAPVTDRYCQPPDARRLWDTLDEGAACTLLEACTDAGLTGEALYWRLCQRLFAFASVRGAAILAKCPPDGAEQRYQLLYEALRAPTVAIMLIEAGYPCVPPNGCASGSIVQGACASWHCRRTDVVAAVLNAGYVATASDLSTAIHNGRTETAKLLLQHCVERGVPLDQPGKDALIVVAARGSHTEIMQLLLEAGVDVGTRESPGRAALCAAASCDSCEGVQMLLRSGADPNPVPRQEADDNTDRPLRTAACTGSLAMIQMLLDAGARVDTLCLRAAARAYRVAACKLLVEATDGTVPVPPWPWHQMEGARPNKCKRQRDDYVKDILLPHADAATMDAALVGATEHGCPGAVQLLLAAGIPGEPDALARMPTTHASARGVAMLLASGYEVTPAVCVRLAPYVSWRCLKDLLGKAGLSVADDVRGPGGDSLLHVAARRGRSQWIQRILLESCSHVDCTNDAGDTPLAVAVQRRSHGRVVFEACALLRGGADPDRVCPDSREVVREAQKALSTCHKRWSTKMQQARRRDLRK